MYILIYRPKRGYCSVMGIFFTRKQAKKARESLMKYDAKKYPGWSDRSEQTKSCYKIEKHRLFKCKKHHDPYQG